VEGNGGHLVLAPERTLVETLDLLQDMDEFWCPELEIRRQTQGLRRHPEHAGPAAQSGSGRRGDNSALELTEPRSTARRAPEGRRRRSKAGRFSTEPGARRGAVAGRRISNRTFNSGHEIGVAHLALRSGKEQERVIGNGTVGDHDPLGHGTSRSEE
jgi:hypothetical protein